MTLTVGSLFSGIGGLDLGLERAGMRVIWQSEIDPYCSKVLEKHWPEVPNYGDIKKINWKEIARPDVICGGYPCQPFSTAGKRRGDQDPRHLWPWVRYSISQLRPRYAILENVRGHLSMGGVDVLGDLASIGYDAEWRVVSAVSVGANHKRDRIIIVAYPIAERLETTRPELKTSRPIRNSQDSGQFVANTNDAGGRTSQSRVDGNWEKEEQGWDDQPFSWFSGHGSDVANAYSEYWYGRGYRDCEEAFRERHSVQESSSRSGFNVANTDTRQTSWGVGGVSESSRLVFGRDNIGRGTQSYAGWQWWETEPNVGRVAHGVPDRVDRLKGLGNAVVPQVAEVIGRLVMEASWLR
jgi:DNA (cytosine-5)-methyltransferase 1